MKVSSELKEGRQAVLNIQMEPAEVESGLQEAYKHLVRRFHIPGFRPGKAPRDVVERFAGREALLEDAIHHLAPEACDKAMEQEGLQSIAQPEVEVLTRDPLVLQATIYMPPVVEPGNYKEIKLASETIEVKQEDIDRVLENLRHRQAIWEPVERPVKFGDLVVVDGEGKQGEKVIWKRKADNFEVLEKGFYPVSGFTEELVGMEKGQNKSFIVKPPSGEQADKADKEEQPVSFTVKLHEIKEEKLAELNDDFVKSLGENLNSLAELTEKIKEELRKRLEEEAREKQEDLILEMIVSESRIEYPSIMLDKEIANLRAMEESRFKSGKSGVEEYLKLIKKTEEQHKEELNALAGKRLQRGLVLDKIKEAEKIEITDTEVEEEIEKRSMASTKPDEMKKIYARPEVKESLKRELMVRKTIDRLITMATQEHDVSKEKAEEPDIESQQSQGGGDK